MYRFFSSTKSMWRQQKIENTLVFSVSLILINALSLFFKSVHFNKKNYLSHSIQMRKSTVLHLKKLFWKLSKKNKPFSSWSTYSLNRYSLIKKLLWNVLFLFVIATYVASTKIGKFERTLVFYFPLILKNVLSIFMKYIFFNEEIPLVYMIVITLYVTLAKDRKFRKYIFIFRAIYINKKKFYRNVSIFVNK